MEKNKTVWMFLTALVISLVIVGGSMTLSVRHQKSAVQGVPTSQPPTDPGYLMRIADGKVGLYRIGSSTPYELLDEPLNLLSEYDREQLEQGITASSEGELRRLLEDFFS